MKPATIETIKDIIIGAFMLPGPDSEKNIAPFSKILFCLIITLKESKKL